MKDLYDLERELREVTRRLDTETFMYADQVKRLERYRLSLIQQIKEQNHENHDRNASPR